MQFDFQPWLSGDRQFTDLHPERRHFLRYFGILHQNHTTQGGAPPPPATPHLQQTEASKWEPHSKSHHTEAACKYERVDLPLNSRWLPTNKNLPFVVSLHLEVCKTCQSRMFYSVIGLLRTFVSDKKHSKITTTKVANGDTLTHTRTLVSKRRSWLSHQNWDDSHE